MLPVVLVHGGARDINDEESAQKFLRGVKLAAKEGYKVLLESGSVLDAVEIAVCILESDETFNAGKGSVLNLEGDVEMDASIMLGSDLSAGAVTVIKNVEHPISVARKVMEKTSHVLLAGDGALNFAKQQGFTVLPEGSLVSEHSKRELDQILSNSSESNQGFGTVGAVAVDVDGHVAAATSTGGFPGKMVGRCSDTSLIGSGTYADDDVGAVSTTGHGESIAKFCLAHAVINQMRRGNSAQEATTMCVDAMTKRLENFAGAITVSRFGDVGIHFTTSKMSWAYRVGDVTHFGLTPGQHETES